MALIKCKECKKEISDKADRCPHCGARMKREPLGCGVVVAGLILLYIFYVAFGDMLNPEKPLPKQASIKTFYQGDNWAVSEVSMTDESRQCELKSSPHYLDSNGNPEHGSTRLKVGHPANNVTFSGEKIGAYFKIAERFMFYVDDDSGIMIIPESPISGDRVIGKMIKGDAVKIKIDFGRGGISVHMFSLSGFAKAYKKLQDCVGIAPKHTR